MYISRKILLGMLHLETPTLVGPFYSWGSIQCLYSLHTFLHMVYHFVSFDFLSLGGDHLVKCRAVNLRTILSSFSCDYMSTCVHTTAGCHSAATCTLFCCNKT